MFSVSRCACWVGLGLLLISPVAAMAQAGAGDAERTSLDQRRLALMRHTDKRHRVVETDGTLGLASEHHEHYFWEKALAIFGLVAADEVPADRVAEANAMIRRALELYPAESVIIGQYPQAWNHRSRSLGVRLYAMFADRFEPDIREEFERRLDLMLKPAWTSKSENIKFSNNAGIFLAHELRGQTDRETYGEVRDWLVNALQNQITDGAHEFGSVYHAWTLSAVLNLADLAEDDAVRRLARGLIDLETARLARFSLEGNFAGGGVRRYPFFVHGTYLPQTTILRTLFAGDPAANSHEQWTEFAVSDYQPLRIVTRLLDHDALPTGNVQLGARWRQAIFRSADVAMAAMQSAEPNRFALPSGGTHDIIGLYVQSSAGPVSHVVPYGYRPDRPPSKKRDRTERYFAHDNVAFAQHGGTTIAVWAGGRFEEIPVRLFHTPDFEVEFGEHWAFLSNGRTYVAWAPTRGEPMADPESRDFADPDDQGAWLVSSHKPDESGEVVVVEVGDAATFGSFQAFRESVRSRNSQPRANDGRVTYQTRHGETLKWTPTGVTLDGDALDATHPGSDASGLNETRVEINNRQVTWDRETGEARGATDRLPTTLRFR